jgi:hypothetical protein
MLASLGHSSCTTILLHFPGCDNLGSGYKCMDDRKDLHASTLDWIFTGWYKTCSWKPAVPACPTRIALRSQAGFEKGYSLWVVKPLGDDDDLIIFCCGTSILASLATSLGAGWQQPCLACKQQLNSQHFLEVKADLCILTLTRLTIESLRSDVRSSLLSLLQLSSPL